MSTSSPVLLRTPEGSAALALAASMAGADPLAAASAMRARGVPPELAATALTQVDLRRRAIGKFGPAAASMFFTRAGLEQATRAVVADRRAAPGGPAPATTAPPGGMWQIDAGQILDRQRHQYPRRVCP